MTHALMLPVHPRTGYRALGHRANGAPIWPVMGGDGSTPPPNPDAPPAGGDPATPSPSSGEPPAGGTPTPTPPKGGSGTSLEDLLKANPGLKDEIEQRQNEIIQTRLAREKAKFEQQLEEAKATAGKTELEAAQIERDRYKDQVGTVTKTAAERIAKTEAKVAALTAGAKSDRVAAVIAQADLTEAVSEDGEVDEAKVAAAIEKVLTDFPEWKADRAPSTSGGELNPGNPGGKPSFTREQIKAMSPEERAARIDEINDALANGRVTS